MLKTGESAYESKGSQFMVMLYSMYSKYVYHLAWKYCISTFDVDDLVQEVWLKLCTKGDQLSGYSREQQVAYIAATVRNTAISKARKKTEAYPLELAAGIFFNEADILNEIFDRQLKIQTFQKIWPTVPVQARELLERKYMMMESDQEIAEVMGISIGSVRMYLTRARKIAFTALEEYRDNLI